jgi:hypothetical protein
MIERTFETRYCFLSLSMAGMEGCGRFDLTLPPRWKITSSPLPADVFTRCVF